MGLGSVGCFFKQRQRRGGTALLECTRCEHRIEWEESADDDRCRDRRGHRDKAIRKQIIFKVISSGA